VITWRWSKLERPLLNHVPNLAVDGDCSDMFSPSLYSVKFGLRARIKWELEIKYMDVCYAAQHEPCGSKEINDCCICARHWLWHSLVCQLATSVQVKHLQVAVLANSNGDVWFLLVKSRPIHCNARLVRLEDVLDAHGGHLDHHKVDVPVWQLLRRLREQQRPFLGEVGDSELNKVADVHSPDLFNRNPVLNILWQTWRTRAGC